MVLCCISNNTVDVTYDLESEGSNLNYSCSKYSKYNASDEDVTHC